MADHLSVAESVVGTISLAIQVTKGLASLYIPYKGRKPDIADTTKKLERLLDRLEVLNKQLDSRIFRANEQDLLTKVEEKINVCTGFIKELQHELMESENPVRAHAHRIAHHLRKSTLERLHENIEEIGREISGALKVLQQEDFSTLQDDEDAKAVHDLVGAEQISLNIRLWLKAPDATTNFREACKKKHPRTGMWFVKGSLFSSWLEKPNSFLWLYGFAGCGKSVLCSTAIQYTLRHRRSNPRVGIAFFFFTFNDQSKQDADAMLRTLVLQLSSQRNDGHELLSRLHNRCAPYTPPYRALLGCLRQLVREFEHVYILLDALDESPRDNPREGMLQALADIRAWFEDGLHLLVTSRDEADIRDVLCDELGASRDQTVSMRNESVDGDIASFVSGYLKDSRALKRWEKYHDQIGQALTERAKGVFRWVECQFLALETRCWNKRQLDKLLASLPPSLDQTYERMLLNIDEESVYEAIRILTLLCCATRPLTTLELIDAIAVELGDNPRLDPDGRLPDDEILRICPGLIEVDTQPDGNTVVRIAHFSVQEYLESPRISQHSAKAYAMRPLEAHAEVASICLTYLLEPAVSKDTMDEFPFARYAAGRWDAHFRRGKITHSTENQALRLIRSPGGEYEKWFRMMAHPWIHRDIGMGSPIYRASNLGLDCIVSRLLCEEGRRSASEPSSLSVSELINAQGGGWGTALQAASYYGFTGVVQLLLDNGADVNAPGGLYGNPLQAASFRSQKGIIQLLLNYGADVNAKGGLYGGAVHAASASFDADESVVQLLLDNGADVNAQSEYSGSALHAASAGGYKGVAQLLLNRGADVNARLENRQSALQAATIHGHEAIIQLLLDNGADINAPGGMFGTALQAAAASILSNERMVQLLLDHGADVNAQGGKYGTALQAACYRSHISVVQLLLDNGADVNAKGGEYGYALQAASFRGNEEMVQLLLDKRADFTLADDKGQLPLHLASMAGSVEVVKLLLHKRADFTVADDQGRTPLYLAFAYERAKVAELLVAAGASLC